ncbi:MAG: VapC toxin family PIN domain ribonuclease [Novosphingobium sp.]|nr:VapC toxin family PIN domain ribonuclease [Novosphingobium sp.]
MLDTNLCIQIIRDKPAGARERFQAASGKLAISTVVLHELHVGVLRSYAPERHLEELQAFLPGVTVLDFDSEAALHAAEIKADLLNKRNVIGPNDLLIAGHARSLGAPLITCNLKEFTRIEGLRCEDWLG